MAALPAPAYRRDFDAQPGLVHTLAPGLARVTAPNAGPYTFTGTNSYLVGHQSLMLVDPGPDDEQHLAALLAAIDGRPLAAIVLTHTHKDHSGLARRLRALTGAPLVFKDTQAGRTQGLVPDIALVQGQMLPVDGLGIDPIFTPGHAPDHFVLGMADTPFILTGDHVMGWSSSLLAPDDTALSDYLASIDRLLATSYQHYLPGHGGPIPQGPDFALALKHHRLARNDQILSLIALGPITEATILDRIYPDLVGDLRRAAALTLASHIRHLLATGAITETENGVLHLS